MAIQIRRREFIVSLGCAAAGWPVVAWAQQRADRVRRIAWFGLGRSDEPSPYVDSLRAGLRDLGWIEGRNLTIGLFWATGREDMEAAGRELLASDPEVIVTQELMVFAMRSLKTTRPVVFGFSARVHHVARRRRSMAARDARAAASDAGRGLPQQRVARGIPGSPARIPSGPEVCWFCRRRKRCDRVPLG